jgi:PAS domain S-box-containing protein
MRPTPKFLEKKLDPNRFIVTRTDIKGKITYCNEEFVNISGYEEEELLGQAHSITRHPDMPRAVFKLLWDVILSGEEVFAYVKNLCKDGEFYWVIAHVTPTFNAANQVSGFHSNRRAPNFQSVKQIARIYEELIAIEQNSQDRKIGLTKSYEALTQLIKQKGVSYNEFILSL